MRERGRESEEGRELRETSETGGREWEAGHEAPAQAGRASGDSDRKPVGRREREEMGGHERPREGVEGGSQAREAGRVAERGGWDGGIGERVG